MENGKVTENYLA